jgi:hypothetical protein
VEAQEVTREEFTKKYRNQMAGAMLYGTWSDAHQGPLEKAGHALDIVPLVPKLLGQMWDDAQPSPIPPPKDAKK